MNTENQTQTPESTERSLFMNLSAGFINGFSVILQTGFLLPVDSVQPLRKVLCGQFGVDEEYLDKSINTIFVDGKSVDNVEDVVISPGSVVSLSGAMPGFVGAALRKGGFYSRMRQEITYNPDESEKRGGKGLFCLKLYNIVVRDLGPLFLSRGILVKGLDVFDFLVERGPRLNSEACLLKLDSDDFNPVDAHSLEILKNTPWIHLTVDVK
jgi:hypothetical protein